MEKVPSETELHSFDENTTEGGESFETDVVCVVRQIDLRVRK